MKTVEKALKPDKISAFREYDDVMKRIVAESKREVTQLQNQRESLIITNRELDDNLVRKQGQFEQWKRLEEQKLQDLKSKLNNEIIRREKAIEIGELDMSRRSEEMSRREEIGRGIIEKEKKLNNDRIEIEKLRLSASNLMESANKKMSDASSLYSQANIAEKRSVEKENKANLINEQIVKREHIVSEKEKELELKSKNLDELSKILDPKIEIIRDIEKKNEIAKKELLSKEQEIDKKINEEITILRNLEIKQKKLAEYENNLNQLDEEIKRKALGINV